MSETDEAKMTAQLREVLNEPALEEAAAAIMRLYRGDGGWCGLEAAREQARVTLMAYHRALPHPELARPDPAEPMGEAELARALVEYRHMVVKSPAFHDSYQWAKRWGLRLIAEVRAARAPSGGEERLREIEARDNNDLSHPAQAWWRAKGDEFRRFHSPSSWRLVNMAFDAGALTALRPATQPDAPASDDKGGVR